MWYRHKIILPNPRSVACRGAIMAAMGIASLPLAHSAVPLENDSKPGKTTVAGEAEKLQTYKITPPPVRAPRAGLDQSLNKLTVDQQGDTAIIHVMSATGMGKLTIQPQNGKWSAIIHVRLHLKGLEGFSVSNDEATVDRAELDIKAYDSEGKPFAGKYLMEEKGFYEAVIPAELFADKTAALTLDWTDFFRR